MKKILLTLTVLALTAILNTVVSTPPANAAPPSEDARLHCKKEGDRDKENWGPFGIRFSFRVRGHLCVPDRGKPFFRLRSVWPGLHIHDNRVCNEASPMVDGYLRFINMTALIIASNHHGHQVDIENYPLYHFNIPCQRAAAAGPENNWTFKTRIRWQAMGGVTKKELRVRYNRGDGPAWWIWVRPICSRDTDACGPDHALGERQLHGRLGPR